MLLDSNIIIYAVQPRAVANIARFARPRRHGLDILHHKTRLGGSLALPDGG